MRVFSRDTDILIGERSIVNLGHNRGRHVLRPFNPVKGRIWLKRNAANLRVQLLQPPGSSNKGPAGAKHGYEMRDAALCLLPNFIGSAQIMSTPIGIIRILVSVEIFLWLGGVKFARLANGAVRPVRRVGINNVGAVSAQNVLALGRNVLRHAQRDRETLSRSDHRVGNACISTGRIQQNPAGTKTACRARLRHNVRCRTILYRSTRIHPFRFAEQLNVREVSRDPLQAQQRRVPNALQRALPERARIRHSFPFSARFAHRIGYLGRFAGSGLHSDLGADYD